MILTLSAILFVSIAMVGKKKGIKTFCSVYINIVMILFAIMLIVFGANPIAVGLIFSLLFSMITLFFLNGFNSKTLASFISVFIVLLLTGFLIWWLIIKSNISGFPREYTDEIAIYSLYVNINFVNVTIAVILMGLIGTITDAALDAATTVNELYENNKNSNFSELLKSGLNVGGDILGTMINTLFFAFFGTFMGYFIWHQEESFVKMINYKAFAFEFIRIASSGLGCVLVIPVSVFVTIILLKKFPYLLIKNK